MNYCNRLALPLQKANKQQRENLWKCVAAHHTLSLALNDGRFPFPGLRILLSIPQFALLPKTGTGSAILV